MNARTCSPTDVRVVRRMPGAVAWPGEPATDCPRCVASTADRSGTAEASVARERRTEERLTVDVVPSAPATAAAGVAAVAVAQIPSVFVVPLRAEVSLPSFCPEVA